MFLFSSKALSSLESILYREVSIDNIIIHILNVYFPYSHGWDEFLNGYLPLSLILCRSRSIFRDLKSLSKSSEVYPFFVAPQQQLTISLHFFTTLSSLHLSTWPSHLNLPLLMQFLMLSMPKCFLSFEEGFLYPSRWHYTSILSFSCHCTPTLISQPFSLPKFHYYTAWPSKTCLVHPTLWAKGETRTTHKKKRTFLWFCYPGSLVAWIVF